MSWYKVACVGLSTTLSGWFRYMRKPSLDRSFFSLTGGEEGGRWWDLQLQAMAWIETRLCMENICYFFIF